MHDKISELAEAVKGRKLSATHFDEVQRAIVAVNEKLLAVEPLVGSNDDEDELLVQRFHNLSRSWSGPLGEMMEDDQRRKELRDIFPSLEDAKLRQLLVEAQVDQEVCHLDRM